MFQVEFSHVVITDSKSNCGCDATNIVGHFTAYLRNWNGILFTSGNYGIFQNSSIKLNIMFGKAVVGDYF